MAGPDNQFAVRALNRSSQIDFAGANRGAEPFGDWLTVLLNDAYPEKSAFLGPARLERLAGRVVAVCRDSGIEDDRGMALMGALMFGFGHAIVRDPMYPWVRNTLERPIPVSRRIERLAAKTYIYIHAMLAHLGQPA